MGYEALYGQVTRDYYVFIKCKACKSIFRWGIYGFREGFIICPYCGCYDPNPVLVDKIEYIKFLERMKNPYNLERRQRKLWNPSVWEG